MDFAPLVETRRGAWVENTHFGLAVVADTTGRVVRAWGNAQRAVFPRSALKPLQALPVLEGGAAAHYGLEAADLAVLCASHSGETPHVRQVARLLARLGLDESALQCGRHVPFMYPEHAQHGTPPLAAFGPLHHNCSGKHAGFLACACASGAATADYLAPDHPAQRAVREALLRTTGCPAEALHRATDGCSAPTYALPLVHLATAYARLATAPTHSAPGHLASAMMAHPEMVSGQGRADAALMHAAPGTLIAKMGADGVQAIGLPGLGLGLAVKIADGHPRAAVCATVAILRRLGVFAELPAVLEPWAQPQQLNARGLVVGAMHAVTSLSAA